MTSSPPVSPTPAPPQRRRRTPSITGVFTEEASGELWARRRRGRLRAEPPEKEGRERSAPSRPDGAAGASRAWAPASQCNRDAESVQERAGLLQVKLGRGAATQQSRR